MDTLLQDLRYGIRMLARNPGFTVVAVVTLAIGIGGTTAIFSFVNAVLLRQLPFAESGRLAILRVEAANPGRFRVTSFTPGDFLDWRSRNQVFEEMTAFHGSTFSLTGAGEPERLQGAFVTDRFFQTLGIAPVIGRAFLPHENIPLTAFTFGLAPSAPGVVVISEALWRRRLGADPKVVGSPIMLDGRPFTVVGVMPAAFTFPRDVLPGAASRPLDVWMAAALEPAYRNNALLQVVGRLKPQMTFERAQDEMTALAVNIAKIGGRFRPDQRGSIRLDPLRERIVRDVRPLLFVFLGAVGFVLSIACANVANLLLARAAARHKEVAVRAALGSGRWRLVRQFMTESVLLGALGGAGGVFVALWGVDAATALLPAASLPRADEIGVDPQALWFTVVVSLASGLAFGMPPAFHASSAEISGVLKDASSAETSRSRVLDVLVVSEVALAFVLLAAAGLMIKSFWRLVNVSPGFRPESTLALSVTLPETAYGTTAQMAGFAADVVERLGAMPGVVHAGAVNWLPLGGSGISGTFSVEGASERARGLMPTKTAVSPDYFRAIGIPLLRGRAFAEGDGATAPGVAIVTSELARHVWPEEDAIGQRLRIGFGAPDEQPLTVVGIVGEVKQNGLGAETPPAIYVPLPQAPRPFLLRSLTFVVRTTGDPLNAADVSRRVIRSVDPNLPIDRIETMERLIASSISEPRFRSVVLTSFAGTALVLVATGILGVLAYSVTRRTREIGVRMALGAQRVDVVRLVVRHALAMTLTGVVIGGIAAVWLTRLLTRFLFQTEPGDPATFVATAAILVGVALVASYVPAHRATGVDPLTALRTE